MDYSCTGDVSTYSKGRLIFLGEIFHLLGVLVHDHGLSDLHLFFYTQSQSITVIIIYLCITDRYKNQSELFISE